MKRCRMWSVLWLVPLLAVACSIQTPGWLQALQGGEQECVVKIGIIYSKSSSGLAQKKGYEMALEEGGAVSNRETPGVETGCVSATWG